MAWGEGEETERERERDNEYNLIPHLNFTIERYEQVPWFTNGLPCIPHGRKKASGISLIFHLSFIFRMCFQAYEVKDEKPDLLLTYTLI